MRSPLPTSSALSAFALDPGAYLPPPPGATVVDDPRFHLTVSPDGRRASVCRLRADDVESVFRDVTAHAPGARVVWVTDGTCEAELRALGCRDQDPPLTSYVTALATETPPPKVDGIEVRRVETYDDFLVAHRVWCEGWGTTMDEDPAAVWQRRSSMPGGEWVAFVDGEPVAFAGATAGPRGLFLMGGVTLPASRGRGAYRALVRARWDEAVRLGTPGLVVHAEAPSRRVLVRVGFEEIAPIVELLSG